MPEAGPRPQTVEDCLEAIYYALIRAEQVKIDRNKWSIDEIEEIQTEDHASVIIHRRLIDNTIWRLDRARALVSRGNISSGNPKGGGVVCQSHHLMLQDISNMTGSYFEGLDEHGRHLFVEPEMLDDGKTEAGKSSLAFLLLVNIVCMID